MKLVHPTSHPPFFQAQPNLNAQIFNIHTQMKTKICINIRYVPFRAMWRCLPGMEIHSDDRPSQDRQLRFVAPTKSTPPPITTGDSAICRWDIATKHIRTYFHSCEISCGAPLFSSFAFVPWGKYERTA